ncbi:MAG: aspartyl/asparaginyl beta-hydroxylase domain-containing protein, partial [Gammaproteobacteria bacterium]
MPVDTPVSFSPEPHFQRAHAALRADDAHTALAEMRAVLAASTPATVRAEAWLLSAAARRSLNEPTAELEALTQALAEDPYFWPALLQKGLLQERQGHPKTAALTFRDVLKIAPEGDDRPPTLRAALDHAAEVVRQYAQALEATLLEAVGHLPGMSARWAEAAAIVSGRSRPYVSVANQLSVPRLPAQPFFRREMFPWVPEFERATAAIREEMLDVLADNADAFTPYVQYQPGDPVNQWVDLNHSRDWTSFHLFRAGEPVPENIARCPNTAAALARIDTVHLAGTCPNAMFSVLAPGARIPPHHGESNARLVAHLPLVVPDHCLFRVGFDTRRWTEGEVLIFDDTIEHEAVNQSDRIRVVLIFDVWNPLLSPE